MDAVKILGGFLVVADCGKSEMQVEKWETSTHQHVKEF